MHFEGDLKCELFPSGKEIRSCSDGFVFFFFLGEDSSDGSEEFLFENVSFWNISEIIVIKLMILWSNEWWLVVCLHTKMLVFSFIFDVLIHLLIWFTVICHKLYDQSLIYCRFFPPAISSKYAKLQKYIYIFEVDYISMNRKLAWILRCVWCRFCPNVTIIITHLTSFSHFKLNKLIKLRY